MSVVVRFAPSPTGLLHVGNARIAIANWLYTRAKGGRFLLRIDDTDPERDREEYAEAIKRDLTWLGLAWDRTERQSARLALYADAAEKLKSAGRLYPCFETPEELSLQRKAQLAAGEPPIYRKSDRALALKHAESGRKPYWRFALGTGEIAWHDVVRGPQRFRAEDLSDPVLIRADGRPLYTMTSPFDDIAFGITHVVRGEDHVSNAASHIRIMEALGGKAPLFAHLPLLVGPGGEGLSKRFGSLSLASLREAGIEAMALVSYLAHLGTSDDIEPFQAMESLIRTFDLDHTGRAQPHFDPEMLKRLNAKLLHGMPFEAVAARLERLDLGTETKRFWETIRGNVETVDDAAYWATVLRGPLKGEGSEAAKAGAAHLPMEPWDGATWGSWTKAVAAATGLKGKALYQPLRRAITGRDHGPEMQNLLPLIGRRRALARLSGDTA